MNKLAYILLIALLALTACSEKPSSDVPPFKRPAGMEVLSVTDPYVVHIMCGINDVAENDEAYVESSAILANIKAMAAQAEEAKIKVVIGSLTPCNKIWWWADDWKPSKEGVTVVSHILEAK